MQSINVSCMGQNPAFINARGSIGNLADKHNRILKIRGSMTQSWSGSADGSYPSGCKCQRRRIKPRRPLGPARTSTSSRHSASTPFL